MTRDFWHPAFVGIGSNLDNPESHVADALLELNDIASTSLIASSHLYYSEPLVPEGQESTSQPDYVNAVAGLLTRCSPLELLEQLQAIEQRHGRDRSAGRWTSRTLDLDILAFGERVIETDRLTIPHPELRNRSFVLIPWREIAPHFTVVGEGTIDRLARRVDPGTLRRINPQVS